MYCGVHRRRLRKCEIKNNILILAINLSVGGTNFSLATRGKSFRSFPRSRFRSIFHGSLSLCYSFTMLSFIMLFVHYLFIMLHVHYAIRSLCYRSLCYLFIMLLVHYAISHYATRSLCYLFKILTYSLGDF